jgi:hypothetical protein
VTSGGGRGGAHGGGRCRGAPGSWTARIDVWCSCEAGGGVSGTGAAPAASNCSACRAGVGGCLGELPGGEAELPRALAGAGVRRSDGSAVEQGAPSGGARRLRCWGVGGGCGD